MEEFRDYYQKFVQRTNLLDEIRKDAHILVKFLVAARWTEELNFSKSILNKVRPKQWSLEVDDISSKKDQLRDGKLGGKLGGNFGEKKG